MRPLKSIARGERRSSCHVAWLAAVAVCAFAAGMLPSANAAEPASTRLEDIGPDEFSALGEEATGTVCTKCHGWDMIFGGPRQTPDQWDFIVSDMVARGASGTPEQKDLIRRYLKWIWGAVWINRATAQDLVQVIGMPEKKAEAVIAWRHEHGDFTDLESLKEVPGIDPAVIDAQADAIMF